MDLKHEVDVNRLYHMLGTGAKHLTKMAEVLPFSIPFLCFALVSGRRLGRDQTETKGRCCKLNNLFSARQEEGTDSRLSCYSFCANCDSHFLLLKKSILTLM